MKITKIHYFFTAPNGLYWNKIGAEAELIEGEDVRQCLYDLKRQVESFFYESKAAAEKQMGTQLSDVSTTPRTSEQAIIEDIGTCNDTKTLEAYRLIAKNNPKIREAYDKKLLELQNNS
jgi:hypothetical protein